MFCDIINFVTIGSKYFGYKIVQADKFKCQSYFDLVNL